MNPPLWPGEILQDSERFSVQYCTVVGLQSKNATTITATTKNQCVNNDPVLTRCPCFVGPADVCPAPPSYIPSVHGPRVRRRSAASPAVVSRAASTRARTQVRPGRSRGARRRSAIGQRRRPAAVPPRRRHAKKERFVCYYCLCFKLRPLNSLPLFDFLLFAGKAVAERFV